MRLTTVTIQRPEGTTLATGIRCQVDQMSDREAALLRQAFEWHAADLYRLYTSDWNPNSLIQRGDVLIDERFTDEDSPGGANFYKYRVVSRPRNYDRQYQSCICEVVVGG